jgi:hypothetical protein
LHSFCNFVQSIILCFTSLFSMVSCNIFTLTFSSISFFCYFQVTIRCLYSSFYYSYFICCNNPYFLPSIVVNLNFNDLISNPNYPSSNSHLPLLETIM